MNDNNIFIGKCNYCGKENVEIDFDFGGCIHCVEEYVKEQEADEQEQYESEQNKE